MRVLHVIAELGSGGAEAVVATLAAAQAAAGVQVAVATAGGRRVPGLRAQGVTVRDGLAFVGRGPVVSLSAAGALWPLRGAPADVIHAHNIKASLAAHLGLRLGARHAPPLVSTFHGVAEADYPRAAAVLSRTSDAVVVVAGAIGQRLLAAGLSGHAAEQLHVVPNAVVPPTLPPRAEARGRLDLPPDEGVALCAARLVPQKRQDLLLRAWALLPGAPVLLLAGDGPDRPALEQLAGRLGLLAGAGPRVRLLGDRSDMPDLLAACDVLTLASDWEGLPMVALEAMAVGCPVVATAVDGLVEAVTAPSAGPPAGVLVPPGDAPALAEALRSVLADPALATTLGQAGVTRTAAVYATRAMVDGYRAVYAGLQEPGPARRRPG